MEEIYCMLEVWKRAQWFSLSLSLSFDRAVKLWVPYRLDVFE